MGREIISAKIDVVFKELFVRDGNLLKHFLSDVLDIPLDDILEIMVANPEIPSDYSDGKLIRLDLIVRLKNKLFNTTFLINVELQVNSQNYFKERTLFYWSKLYTSELKSGESYNRLKRTICINILDFNITDKQDYHTEVVISDKETGEIFTNLLSIHFFELRKVKKSLDVNDRKAMWMHLIKADTEEELNMIKDTKIPVMEQAVQVIFDMSADAVLRERARMREKALHDEISALEGAREDGIAIGKMQGKSEESARIADRLHKMGMTDKQIREILSH